MHRYFGQSCITKLSIEISVNGIWKLKATSISIEKYSSYSITVKMDVKILSVTHEQNFSFESLSHIEIGRNHELFW